MASPSITTTTTRTIPESDESNLAVELIVCDGTSTAVDAGDDEIAPLLNPPERKPKINIFALPYSGRKPRDHVIKSMESSEISAITQLFSFVWNGSRYSGLLCMALSSTIYFIMELAATLFSTQSIPLFQTAFARCTIVSILSYSWLKRSGQPIFGPPHARSLLILRAVMGYLSLLCFVYSIQMLPLSQAIVLSFTTPIMASIAARIILHERLRIFDVGGLAGSFFGMLFIFHEILTIQGELAKTGAKHTSNRFHHIYAVLGGLISSITGGISYCLIKAGAKASDHPVVPVFSFGILAGPAAAICTFVFEEFVMPGFWSIFLMVILGVLAFFAEVFLARGLQLEKTSKVANIQYLEAVLLQLWGISISGIAPTFGQLIGCLLIIGSVCSTMYIGPDKETE